MTSGFEAILVSIPDYSASSKTVTEYFGNFSNRIETFSKDYYKGDREMHEVVMTDIRQTLNFWVYYTGATVYNCYTVQGWKCTKTNAQYIPMKKQLSYIIDMKKRGAIIMKDQTDNTTVHNTNCTQFSFVSDSTRFTPEDRSFLLYLGGLSLYPQEIKAFSSRICLNKIVIQNEYWLLLVNGNYTHTVSETLDYNFDEPSDSTFMLPS